MKKNAAAIAAARTQHFIGFRRGRHEAVFLFMPILLRCMSPVVADCVAKVVLHWCSKILRATGADFV